MKMNELRWSKWVESMRKNIKCTFGVLKDCWRILKTGIRVQGVESCDKVRLTCCALHNWLLETDGLDKEWDSVVEADGLSSNIVELATAVSLQARTSYDTLGTGAGKDVVDIVEERHPADVDLDDSTVWRSLGCGVRLEGILVLAFLEVVWLSILISCSSTTSLNGLLIPLISPELPI
ncbi:hypothetical protein ACHAWX_000589 [Stephanocyclus meneghinianus]